MAFWGKIYLDNTLQNWVTALIVTCIVFILMWALKNIIARRFASLFKDHITEVKDLIETLSMRTRLYFLFLFSLYFGSLILVLPPWITLWAKTLALISLIIQGALWLDTLLHFWLTQYQKRKLEDDAARTLTMRAVSFLFRLVLFSIVVILVLDNIPGVEVTALLASMGIGGIAVALAMQNILSDLFASLSISFDKPFILGDFIIVGDLMGTVEHIGLKTTRIRSISGEQLIFSNNDLLSSRIRNYKRMAERRVVFSVGVTFQTPAGQLEEIPSMIREFVESHENTRFDRAHFKEYGDFALKFEAVYYMLTPDYTLYMDTQQAINLAIYKRFREKNIEFAYPTQTLYIDRENAKNENGTA